MVRADESAGEKSMWQCEVSTPGRKVITSVNKSQVLAQCMCVLKVFIVGAEAQDDKPPQKYVVGEKVKATSWGGKLCTGAVSAIKWTYHQRMNEHVWGYAVSWRNGHAPSTYAFTPEGYLTPQVCVHTETKEHTFRGVTEVKCIRCFEVMKKFDAIPNNPTEEEKV